MQRLVAKYREWLLIIHVINSNFKIKGKHGVSK